jgi:hypothetical protein
MHKQSRIRVKLGDSAGYMVQSLCQRPVENVNFDNDMLLKIARSSLGQYVVGFVFARLAFLLPVKRIYESPRLIAFRHPWPGYTTHILIVPKKSIPGVAHLEISDGQLLVEVIQAASFIAERLALKDFQTRLVVNA